MATETRYIYSHYTPERTETVTDQNEDENADPWATERPFGVNERIARPPRFVAASAAGIGARTDELASDSTSSKITGDEGRNWYLSLERNSSSSSSTPRGASKLTTSTPPPNSSIVQPRPNVKKSDGLWFIQRALKTRELEQPEASGSGTCTPTLADILTRDPPPLPSEERFKPPVWLAVGPNNKGFAMLQKRGWAEGEAVGMAARRRAGLGSGKDPAASCSSSAPSMHVEVIDVDEVIDLTLSEDEDEDSEDDVLPVRSTMKQSSPDVSDYLDHDPHSLITPIPTVLKSDRLGIGLKAKTIGPYRESVKKVTHSQAAMAAHARASEEMRRRKQLIGRGRRGFERLKKSEERSRKSLLAYMNAS